MIWFCARTYNIYNEKQDALHFGGIPVILHDEHLELLATKGFWAVFCSVGHLFSEAATKQIVGKEESSTSFLFHGNPSVAEEHVELKTVDSNRIEIRDLERKPTSYYRDGEWQDLPSGKSVHLPSGSYVRFGLDTICRIWTRWIPKKLENIPETKIGKEELILHKGALVENAQIVVYQDEQQTQKHVIFYLKEDNNLLLNGKPIVIGELEKGDRISIAKEKEYLEYEYYVDTLSPVLPLFPLTIEMNQIEVKNRIRLENVTCAKANFTVVLGESGAGKSTTIKLITGWLKADKGEVVFKTNHPGNGKKEIQTEKMAYVPQYDITYDTITVEHNLMYNVILKGKQQRSIEDIKKKIKHLLLQMNLFLVKDKKICELSGGQRKRINIANELIMEDASLVVLDEPTSGLDLANDYIIMEMLRRLAHQGRTVICITHHLANMQLFDYIIVLEKNKAENIGEVAWQGTPSEASCRYDLTMHSGNHHEIFAAKETNILPENKEIATPFSLKILKQKWWVLLMRRFNEFFHPAGNWINLVSMMLLIPLFIGFAITLACGNEGALEKAGFLLMVASFWLGMSIASPEFLGKRYKIFLHEKMSGIPPKSWFIAIVLFFAFISFVQVVVLISPSKFLMHFEEGSPKNLLKKPLFQTDIYIGFAKLEIVDSFTRKTLSPQIVKAFTDHNINLSNCEILPGENNKSIQLKTTEQHFKLTNEDFVCKVQEKKSSLKKEVSLPYSSIASLDRGIIIPEMEKLFHKSFRKKLPYDAELTQVEAEKEWCLQYMKNDRQYEYKFTYQKTSSVLQVWNESFETLDWDIREGLLTQLNAEDKSLLTENVFLKHLPLTVQASIQKIENNKSWVIEDKEIRYMLVFVEELMLPNGNHLANGIALYYSKYGIAKKKQIINGANESIWYKFSQGILTDNIYSEFKKNNIVLSSEISIRFKNGLYELQSEQQKFFITKNEDVLTIRNKAGLLFTVDDKIKSSSLADFFTTNGVVLPSIFSVWTNAKKEIILDNRFMVVDKTMPNGESSLQVYYLYSHLFIYVIYAFLIWLMGISGTIIGLNTSLFHSVTNGKLPTTVTVPCITVLQLIFSSMVMNISSTQQKYYWDMFYFHNESFFRDIFYFFTISRYPERALNSMLTYSNTMNDIFVNNVLFFILFGLVIPSMFFYLFLKITKIRE